RIMREQAEQAKLDTQRKAFDQAMYERSMTPSFAEKQQKEQADQLQRVMTVPQEYDIVSGKAENLMLPFLKSLSSQGIQGPPVLLDPEQMRRVNVTVGSSGGGLGPLMNAGYITDWPLALQGPTQEKLAVLLPMAVAEATAGKLSPKTYSQVKGLTAQLRQEVIKNFQEDKVDSASYLTATRFLTPLDKAITDLQKPGSSRILDGSLAAKG